MEGEKKIVMNVKERRIIVGVDESEESMYALSWCLDNLLLSRQDTTTQTTLILLYVKPPPPVYSSLNATEYIFAKDVVATMEQHGRELVDSVMTRADSVFRGFDTINIIKVEKKVGSGEAKNVICTAVQTLEADILVMGTHDYGFFKRALLGSVSDYCAKNVKCPVVVVKRPKNM